MKVTDTSLDTNKKCMLENFTLYLFTHLFSNNNRGKPVRNQCSSKIFFVSFNTFTTYWFRKNIKIWKQFEFTHIFVLTISKCFCHMGNRWGQLFFQSVDTFYMSQQHKLLYWEPGHRLLLRAKHSPGKGGQERPGSHFCLIYP